MGLGEPKINWLLRGHQAVRWHIHGLELWSQVHVSYMMLFHILETSFQAPLSPLKTRFGFLTIFDVILVLAHFNPVFQ